MKHGKHYSLILLDADGTLFDYDRAEQYSLIEALRQSGLAESTGTDRIFMDYRRINAQMWADLEKGLMTKDLLRTERFRLLFDLHDLSADPQVFSDLYLDRLAHSSFLLDGAEDLCRELHRNAKLIIVTNGIREVQMTRLAASPLLDYVDGMVVSEEVGVGKPEPAIFSRALELAGHTDKPSVVMVGDSLTADILGGIRFGIDTCWVNLKGASADAAIHPTYEVRDLPSLKGLLGV